MSWYHWCGVLVSVTLIACAQESEHKSASVNLKARWQGTSLALEALEFLADLDSGTYIKGLDAWTHASSTAAPPSQQTCWDHILAVFQPLLPGPLFRLLHLHLATREYSARIEAFRQLALQSLPADLPYQPCCWAVIDGVPLLTPKVVLDALKRPGEGGQDEALDEEVLSQTAIDHVYMQPPSSNGTVRQLTLYGAPGTACFNQMHETIVLALRTLRIDSVKYLQRPVLLDACDVGAASSAGSEACLSLGTEEPPILAGFGVELAVKNMEYSQVDDAVKAVQQGNGTDDAALVGEVKGFLFDTLLQRKPHLRQELLTFRDALLSDEADSDGVLPIWDLKDLGVQTAQRIAAAGDPLSLMLDITGTFPSLASALSKTRVNKTFAKALAAHGQSVAPGESFMLVNGLAVDMGDTFELSGLLHVVQRDLQLHHVLANMGMHPVDAARMLEIRAHDKSGSSQVRVDLQSDACLWLNDLEKDAMYKSWPRKLRALLTGGGMFGQPPAVARNAINLQLIVDPLSAQGLEAVSTALQMYANGMPARIGAFMLIPTALERARQRAQGRESEAPPFDDMSLHEQFIRYFLAVYKGFGRQGSWQFWYMLAEEVMPQRKSRMMGMMGMMEPEDDEPISPPKDITPDVLQSAFVTAWEALQGHQSKLKAFAKHSADAVITMLEEGELVGVEGRLNALAEVLIAKGLDRIDGGMLAVNGKLEPLGDSPGDLIMNSFQTEMQELQMKVYDGTLQDSSPNIYAKILDNEGALPRYSALVLGQSSSPSSSQEPASAMTAPRHVILDDTVLGPGASHAARLSYLHAPNTQDDIKAVTHWIVTDSASGGPLLASAASYLGSPEGARSRVALVLNLPAAAAPSDLARFLVACTGLTSRVAKLPPFLLSLASNAELWQRLSENVSGALAEAVRKAGEAGLNAVALQNSLDARDDSTATLAAMAALVQALQLAPGAQAVVTNGRLLVTDAAQPLASSDFAVMDFAALKLQSGSAVLEAIEESQEDGRTLRPASSGEGDEDEELTSQQLSDMVMVAASVAARPAGSSATSVDRQLFSAANMQLSVQLQAFIEASSDSVAYVSSRRVGAQGAPSLTVKVCLDPLSVAAQKIATILLYLRDHLDAEVGLLLNPQTNIGDLPLKSYYAYSMPELRAGAPPTPPRAWFPRLPAQRVLTLNIAVPEAWLVEATRADLDTDNLKLADLNLLPTLHVQFELEALMLTGACVDVAAKTRDAVHPRGTQLYLGTSLQPQLHDTLVMSNLGYFQLKAAPGLWRLGLAEGRSRELFRIVDSGVSKAAINDDSAANPRTHTTVLLYSLSGRHITLPLRKQPGFEGQDVLQEAGAGSDEDEEETLEGRVERAPVEGDVINIFSIASGHMYERLQKIMMLSVVKNTRAKVKFWLIKNYMSPQMRAFMPYMAEHYGFEVEMVTYKWPHWLHKQSNKQRIIWAYKILFLDVLFPLGVKRIIFCDSDQIIRADMAELYHIDMHGKPLAYTPFCENNKEMDGFRFWNGGFWKDHLRDKPYHISALYVVDLQVFRQMAAGDRLRIVYDSLSKDPNSLANLDQDLPNYAQHQVPIHSLPQEWLWCESWCGNETKPAARTIDLCNNPQTKEPKLQAARRIVKEWPSLDDEATAFTNKVQAMLATGASDISVPTAGLDNVEL